MLWHWNAECGGDMHVIGKLVTFLSSITFPHWFPASSFPDLPTIKDWNCLLLHCHSHCCSAARQGRFNHHSLSTLTPQRPRLSFYSHLKLTLNKTWRATWCGLPCFCASLLRPLVSLPTDIQYFQHFRSYITRVSSFYMHLFKSL